MVTIYRWFDVDEVDNGEDGNDGHGDGSGGDDRDGRSWRSYLFIFISTRLSLSYHRFQRESSVGFMERGN